MGLFDWLTGKRRPAEPPPAPASSPAPAVAAVAWEEPDWPQRLLAAHGGRLPNASDRPAGAVPAPDGRLLVIEPAYMDKGLAVAVEPGRYAVRVVVLQRLEDGEVVDERVSHAFAELDGATVAHVEPVEEDGAAAELGVDSGLAGFATPGAPARLVADLGLADAEALEGALFAGDTDTSPFRFSRRWGHAATADGAAAMTLFSSGEGDGTYPVYRLLDADGRTVGVALDLYVMD
jgi:hypothetical protein